MILNEICNYYTLCLFKQWGKTFYRRKTNIFTTKIDVKMLGNHKMGLGVRNASRYREQNIPSYLAWQGKAFISWGRGIMINLGGATARKNNQNINWQNTHRIHKSEGFTGSSTQHIPQASSGELYYNRKFHLNQQIKREISENRLFRCSSRTYQGRTHRPGRTREKWNYYMN